MPPLPKSPDVRRRRNARSTRAIAHAPTGPLELADEVRHPLAVQWYEALCESPLADEMALLDYATAQVVLAAVSQALEGDKPMSASMVDAFTTAAAHFGATVEARKRLERELTAAADDPTGDDGEAVVLDYFRTG